MSTQSKSRSKSKLKEAEANHDLDDAIIEADIEEEISRRVYKTPDQFKKQFTSYVYGKRVFIVERILNDRVRFGKVEYLIKWLGHPKRCATWEPYDNVLDKSIIAKYNRGLGRRYKQ